MKGEKPENPEKNPFGECENKLNPNKSTRTRIETQNHRVGNRGREEGGGGCLSSAPTVKLRFFGHIHVDIFNSSGNNHCNDLLSFTK